MDKKTIIILASIISFTIISFSAFSFFKQLGINEQKDHELRIKQLYQDENRKQLQSCINDAKIARTNLWNANCPDNKKGCSLEQSTIKWIDSRYEQDIKNCNSLYK